MFQNAALFPILGYTIGKICQDRIPVIDGITGPVSNDNLKAFGAAAASSGAVGLFHMVGVTPEAVSLEEAFQGAAPEQRVEISPSDVLEARQALSTTQGEGTQLDAVILGCPHLSFNEFRSLAGFIQAYGGKLHPGVRMILNTNQASIDLLERCEYRELFRNFGAEIVSDTCVFHTPILSTETRAIMTNSGKFAYYAPGELNTQVFFGDMEECFHSAVSGAVRWGDQLWKS
jgi:predicted aconitase